FSGNGTNSITFTPQDDGVFTVTQIGAGPIPVFVTNVAPNITATPDLELANGGAGVREGQKLSVEKTVDGNYALKVDDATVDTFTFSDPSSSDLASATTRFTITDPERRQIDLLPNSLQFDGVDDSIETELIIDQSASSPGATFEAWVYPTNSSTGFESLFATGSGFNWALAISNNNWLYKTGTTAQAVDAVTFNTWQHVAITFNPATGVHFFIDGLEVASNPNIGFDVTSDVLRIGTGSFAGRMQEVRVWNRALNASDIQAQNNGPISPSSAGLVGYWPLSKGVGDIATDLASQRNDGIINGNPTWSSDVAPDFSQYIVPDDGDYTLTVSVNDGDGGIDRRTQAFVVDNLAPTIVLTGSLGTESAPGESLVFDASGTTDPGLVDQSQLTYAWEVSSNNGQVIPGSTEPTFSFDTEYSGRYVVTTTVTDKDGAASTETTTITVNPVPVLIRQPRFGGGELFSDGDLVSYDASQSSPLPPAHLSRGNLLLVSREFFWETENENNQVVARGAEELFRFVAEDDGDFTTTLTITDVFQDPSTGDVERFTNTTAASDTLSVTDSILGIIALEPAAIDIANLAPAEGDDLVFSATNLTSLPPLGATVNLLDTSRSYLWQVTAANGQIIAPGTDAEFSFTPIDEGDYTLSLTVTDQVGVIGLTSGVTGVDSTIQTGVDTQGSAGANEIQTLTISDAESGDFQLRIGTNESLRTGSIDFSSDGDTLAARIESALNALAGITVNVSGGAGTWQIEFTEPANTNVDQLQVIDTGAEFTVVTEVTSPTFTTLDVTPTIALVGTEGINEGSAFTLNLSALTDPGDDVVTQYHVHWGDNTTDIFTAAEIAQDGDVLHTFVDDGAYTITVDLVSDGSLFTDTGILEIQINNVSPQLTLSGAASVAEGSTYSLTLGEITDPANAVWQPITVNNFSFENPAHVPGGSNGIIPDWVDGDGADAGAGTFDPTASRYPLGLSDGENVAFSNGPSISQVVGANLTAGQKYRLQVDVGNRNDIVFPGFDLQLRAGGVVLAGADETTVTVPDGGFATATVEFIVPVGHAQLGQPLEIVLDSDGGQTNFDNVRLSQLDASVDTVTEYQVAWGDDQTTVYAAADIPANRVITHVYADGYTAPTIAVALVDEDGTHSANARLTYPADLVTVDGPREQVTLPLERDDLRDSEGYWWDINATGSINDGSSDAFDYGHHLNGFLGSSNAETEFDGREVVIGPETEGAVQVTRKVFIPVDQSYARFLEIVSNPGTTAASYTVAISTNLGSGSSTNIAGTSSGDTAFSLADDWIVTDDSNENGGDPVILHVIDGAGGIEPNTAIFNSNGAINYSYVLNLAPGETQIVMHFGAQNASYAAALQKGTDLAGVDLNALAGMTISELNAVVNFDVAPVINVSGDATFTLTGNIGSTLISVVEGESFADVAERINHAAVDTGVIAEASNVALTLNSVAYGEAAFIDINVTDGNFETTGMTRGRNSFLAIEVTDVAPVVGLVRDANVNEGTAYALTLDPLNDPGTDTILSYEVDWGDGQLDTYAFNDLATLPKNVSIDFDDHQEFVETTLVVDQTASSPGATFEAWVYPAAGWIGQGLFDTSPNGELGWGLFLNSGGGL
ncbi:MAG: hypothetical protein ACI9HK_004760, partial [Pirellulaceae bacterium]